MYERKPSRSRARLIGLFSAALAAGGLGACGSTPGGSSSTDANKPGTVDSLFSDTGPVTDGRVQASTGVTVIVEPDGNKANPVIAAVTAATTSVYMTMYELDDANLISALTARASHGVTVKVILDSSTTNKTSNTPAYNTLHAGGVNVIWSDNVKFMFTHEKTVMIDDKTAWIMTMNANTSVPYDNREYIAVDTDLADVNEAIAIFNADFADTSITPTGDLVVAPTNARSKLYALMSTATKNLDLEVEEFSDADTDGIEAGLVAAAKRGVAVRVVIANETLEAEQTNANKAVKAAGGKIVMTGPASGEGTTSNPYIHAKAITIDCVTPTTCVSGWIGSENMTAGSLGYNRELGVIIDDATELAKVEAAINTDFAAGVAQ
jgi:phosphatidylserine/phosphatidylglycerophosphate/cardiolipin synthase-like enzyme